MKGNFDIVGPLLVIAFYWFIRVSKADAKRGKAWPWIAVHAFVIGLICVLIGR